MGTRIVHLSDLHCPARNEAQAGALVDSVKAAKPDIVAISGDLTRRGRRREFRVAADLVAQLPGRHLVVPGNHDVPVREIVMRPFERFAGYFPDQPFYLETADVFLTGFNSALWSRFGDWSLGAAPRLRTAPVEALIRERAGGRLAVVICHHPLRPHALDVRRSETARGPEAFAELAAAGMRLLLHGHLHRSSKSCVEAVGATVCELCANTALSDRERAGTAGYNIIDVADGDYGVTTAVWTGSAYEISVAL